MRRLKRPTQSLRSPRRPRSPLLQSWALSPRTCQSDGFSTKKKDNSPWKPSTYSYCSLL